MVEKPTVIFDGDCGFCRYWVDLWRRRTGDCVTYEAFQNLPENWQEIPRKRFAESVHLVFPDGRVFYGARAVFEILALGSKHWPLQLYRKLPGFESLSEWGYRMVASYRETASALLRFYFKISSFPSSYGISALLFTRGACLIYAISFLSLLVQIKGLIGSEGIIPAHQFLEQVRSVGFQRFWLVPTIFWLNDSDFALQAGCAVGAAFALAGLWGWIQGLGLLACWSLYLSLVSVGGEFLSFQWDALLLETGFLAFWLFPWRWKIRMRSLPAPSRPIIWLLQWLMFRFMLMSGLVKVFSGDMAWRDLTALTYHYQTQPLPNLPAWWMHQLPVAAHQLMTLLMLIIELVLPFLIFFRPLRLFATVGFALLQFVILLTGNHAFFNWLTLVICLPLIEDNWWRRWFPQVKIEANVQRSPGRAILIGILFCGLVLQTVLTWNGFFGGTPAYQMAGLHWLEEKVAPLQLVNTYGPFARMTRVRDEIRIEGSRDGVTWTEYRLPFKPSELNRAPRWNAPYQPRLDWQMWFEGINAAERRSPSVSRWFANLCVQLLKDSRPVRDLYRVDPFGDTPPKYVRAMVSRYEFTSWPERSATGNWWKKGPDQLYLPAIQLNEKGEPVMARISE